MVNGVLRRGGRTLHFYLLIVLVNCQEIYITCGKIETNTVQTFISETF
jgi:hypothetical protein